jgi:hypothetical protein
MRRAIERFESAIGLVGIAALMILPYALLAMAYADPRHLPIRSIPPLLAIIVPFTAFQSWCLYRMKRLYDQDRQPVAEVFALVQRPVPAALMPLVAAWWSMQIAFGQVVPFIHAAASKARHLTTNEEILRQAGLIAFSLGSAYACNAYLLATMRHCRAADSVIRRVWRYRWLFDALLGIATIAIGRWVGDTIWP